MNKQRVGDAYYGETAEKYFEKRTVERVWQYEQSIVDGLLNEFPDGLTVLDLPFGTGRFVDFYLAKNMKIYGMEISKDMIEAAKGILGDSFSCCEVKAGDATNKLPYADNIFDLIVCFRFLKFFPHHTAKNILNEFNRVSKSKVIISMKLRKQSEPPVGSVEKLEKIGENLYESDVIKLFQETGFEVEKRIRIKKNEVIRKQKTANKTLDKIYRHFRQGTIFTALLYKMPLKKKTKTRSTAMKSKKERVVYILKKV